jgi:UDPglucose 6-dehydrogenase
MLLKIGIIGNGFVGSATQLLNTPDIEMLIYDIDDTKCVPQGTTLNDLITCNLIFICVPTPMNTDGSCYTGIVSQVIQNIRTELQNTDYNPHIVVRSTVPPGFCDKHGVYFIPEFLTEKNWEYDFINCKQWIIGTLANNTSNTQFIKDITKLFDIAYSNHNIKSNKISFIQNKEAEMVKYTRNTFLAVKVSYFNEIYELSNKLGIDYNNVIQNVLHDERIGNSHTSVPGHDGFRGVAGICLPKDCSALLHVMKENNMKSYVLHAAQQRNITVDRPEQDWMLDIGRATV